MIDGNMDGGVLDLEVVGMEYGVYPGSTPVPCMVHVW